MTSNLNQQLRDSDSMDAARSLYNSALLKSEAANLIGEVSILIQESNIKQTVRTTRPSHTHRAADARVQGNQLKGIYENEFSNRMGMIRDLILKELGREKEYKDHQKFQVSNSEFNVEVIPSIQSITEELAKLAAEL